MSVPALIRIRGGRSDDHLQDDGIPTMIQIPCLSSSCHDDNHTRLSKSSNSLMDLSSQGHSSSGRWESNTSLCESSGCSSSAAPPKQPRRRTSRERKSSKNSDKPPRIPHLVSPGSSRHHHPHYHRDSTTSSRRTSRQDMIATHRSRNDPLVSKFLDRHAGELNIKTVKALRGGRR
ncbi:expressed unknown protein [Seminavis robusta]|uniref:Uncharacterized protein n=1 Tax=Seminavis robusta TaxID=568900 RepID=A0A9N8D742_9STRA|nr:expressed unknown protein [Seminavis robusta]|eukprot:Sro23_g015720.1 n/a (176) ;mRNA; r:58243-58770